jgi:hypothetical protein
VYGVVLMGSTNITLYSQQTAVEHTLTVNYGAAANGMTVQYRANGADGTATVSGGKITLELPYGANYSISSPAVTGYTPSQTTVAGVMGSSDRTVDVLYTKNSYALTIHYLYEDGTTASGTVTRQVEYGAGYSETSPSIAGYTADSTSVSGTMGTSDVDVTVTYSPVEYTLTINYQYTGGSQAATSVTRAVKYGESYSITSPVIDGYTPSQTTVSGTLPENKTVLVLYSAGQYTGTFNIEGETPIVHRYEYGATIAVPSTGMTGYTFSGWSWSCGSAPTTMPDEDVFATGRYIKNSYTLTIHYVYATGGQAAQTVTQNVLYGDSYSVASPSLPGYTVNVATVTGVMGASNQTVTVTYTAQPTPPSGGGTGGGGDTDGGDTTEPEDTVTTDTRTVDSEALRKAAEAGTGSVTVESSLDSAVVKVSDAAYVAGTGAKLTVETKTGSVTLTGAGLGTLTAGLAQNADLEITVKEAKVNENSFSVVSGNTVLKSVEVTLTANGSRITKGFGTMSITIPVGEAYAGKTVSILHMKDDGAYTVLTAQVGADGNAVISVDSLSSFVAVKETVRPVSDIFTDVRPTDWFIGYVQYVYDEGLMNGMTDTTFIPGETASRAMVVTVLWRMAGSPTGAPDAGFEDLQQNWYKEAVNWAFANNITTGKSEAIFDPSSPVTREQLAAFFYRFSSYMGYSTNGGVQLTGYSDAAEISAYAEAAMEWAVGSGIITGRTTTELAPGGNTTRAEMAAMLTRLSMLAAK